MNIATCKYHDQVHLAVVQDNSVFLPATSNEWQADIQQHATVDRCWARILTDLAKYS